MKIKFNDGREYDVFSVTHQMDENDVPIDIVIYGTKENLEQIAKYASIGVNIQNVTGMMPFNQVYGSTIQTLYIKHYMLG